ncbi:MAG: hypothetical protein AAB628_00190 [Patescibacteria group bacterium]
MSIALTVSSMAGFVIVVVGGLTFWRWLYKRSLKNLKDGDTCPHCKRTNAINKTVTSPVADASANLFGEDGEFPTFRAMVKIWCEFCNFNYQGTQKT